MIQEIKKLVSGQNALRRRASEWPRLRNWYLSKNPKCAACGSTENLEVHHLVPYAVAPELELSVSNLMTLCESKKLGFSCHLVIGHHGNFKLANKWAREDAKTWHERMTRFWS